MDFLCEAIKRISFGLREWGSMLEYEIEAVLWYVRIRNSAMLYPDKRQYGIMRKSVVVE